MRLLEIIRQLEATQDALELEVLDPDLGADADGIHRPYRVWFELAERLGFRMCTPRPTATQRVRLRFERLVHARVTPVGDPDKYGPSSEFARTTKLDDPGFVIDFAEALERIALPERAAILDLGCNTGDVFALTHALRPDLVEAAFVGVDRSDSALERARQRFPSARFFAADLNQALPLGDTRFDLVIASATLQSPSVDDRALLRRVFHDHLAADGAILIIVPNCRIAGTDIEYGARVRNLRQPELGLVIKDIAFYRKYLHQHRRHVYVTGKHYFFVTGVARSRADGPD
jgi:SAM-dependent methyltransferase